MRRSVRNLSFVLASDLVSRLLGFFAVTWLARRLGVDDFGVIGFSLAALSYGLIATDLGLLKLGTREIARNHGAAPRYAGAVLILRTLLAVIGLAGLGVFAIVIPRSETARLVIVAYAFSLLPVALLLEWVFQGMERMEHIAVSRLLLMAVYLTLVLTLVRRPGQVLLVPLLWLCGNVASALYLLIVYHVRVGRLRPNTDLRFWGELLKTAVPLGIGTILSQVYMNFGLLMLGVMAAGEPAGWFTAAQRLVYFVLVVDRVFYLVAFPIVSRRLRDLTRPEALDVMNRLAKLVLLVTIPIALCTLPLAGSLLNAIFGPDYLPAAPALAVLVWLTVTTTLSSLYGYGLVAVNDEPRYARNVGIGAAFVMGLSLALVPFLKALGAALALVGGELVMMSLMYRDFRRVLKAEFIRFLWRPALVAGLLAAGIRFVRPARVGSWFAWAARSVQRQGQIALVIIIILAIAIYFGIMYLLHGVGKEEFALLRADKSDLDSGPGGPVSGAGES
jgi:O-antigen/teichoic acid export membrane protein